MKQYERYTYETESICWSCENCTNALKCPWAAGKERHDWTVIRERDGITVTSCKGYEEDWKPISAKDLSKLVKCCVRTLFRWDNEKILKKANKAGYRLKIFFTDMKNRYFWIAKIL